MVRSRTKATEFSLEVLRDGKDNEKRVAIYTDSKITLDLLQNKFKRNCLIELIRNKLIALAHSKWIVHFAWVKGHAGIEGNELVDRLAKEAAVEEGPVVCDKIPRDVIVTTEKDKGLHMWEQQWMDTGKGGQLRKLFFPISEEQATTKYSNIPRVNNNTNRTWENKFILI